MVSVTSSYDGNEAIVKEELLVFTVSNDFVVVVVDMFAVGPTWS